MSRVFWDTMLFIYLTENHSAFQTDVLTCLRRSYTRNDVLFTVTSSSVSSLPEEPLARTI